jgi:hypothetical protein
MTLDVNSGSPELTQHSNAELGIRWDSHALHEYFQTRIVTESLSPWFMDEMCELAMNALHITIAVEPVTELMVGYTTLPWLLYGAS